MSRTPHLVSSRVQHPPHPPLSPPGGERIKPALSPSIPLRTLSLSKGLSKHGAEGVRMGGRRLLAQQRRPPLHEIYCDNAATSFPKPPGVLQAIIDYTNKLGASAGRGAYPRALATERLLRQTRESLARLFHVSDPPRIIFTLNASEGLNLAIKGLHWSPGDVAVVSMLEHNSVLRPLNALREQRGIAIVKVPCAPDGHLDPIAVARAIHKGTKLIAIVHASNVMGAIAPIAEIGAIARRKGIPFLVDAAQSAGTLPIDVEAMNIDLLAFPGHKGLLGPLGTGGLYIREGIDLRPLKEGGTGSVSEQEVHPSFLPDRYEAGSHNAMGIAGLHAALEFLQRVGIPQIAQHKTSLTECFLKEVSSISGVKVYGPSLGMPRTAVVSLNLEGYPPAELAHYLATRFGIMVRSGLHCAPIAHQTIGTYPHGTVRFSFSYFSTPKDIEYAVSALRELAHD